MWHALSRPISNIPVGEGIDSAGTPFTVSRSFTKRGCAGCAGMGTGVSGTMAITGAAGAAGIGWRATGALAC